MRQIYRRNVHIVLIGLGLTTLTAIVPLHHGLGRRFIDAADADIIYVFEALLLNEGLPQHHFDHPGYIYYLFLGGWFRLLHALGILDVVRLSGILALAPNDLDASYARLVAAGRALSILLCGGFVATFFFGVRRLASNTLAAALSAAIFAFGIGIAMQSLVLRNELLSSWFAFLAFLTMTAAAHKAYHLRCLFLGCCGFFATLAMATKVQAIVVLLALPVLSLAFGKNARARAIGGDQSEQRATSTLLWLCAVAVGLPVTMMIVRAIQMIGGTGLYQAATALYVLTCMLTYAAVYRVSPWQTIDAVAALTIGVSLGFFLQFIRHDVGNVLAIVNFVDHMKQFSSAAATSGTPGLAELTGPALDGVKRVLLSRTIGLNIWRDPFRAIEWAVLGGGLLAIWRGRRHAAVQTLLLLGLALFIEAVFNLRYFSATYRIYTDPWLLAAAALLLAQALNSATWRGLSATGVTLLSVLIVAASLNLTWNATFPPKQPDRNACDQAAGYMPQLAQHFSRYCR